MFSGRIRQPGADWQKNHNKLFLFLLDRLFSLLFHAKFVQAKRKWLIVIFFFQLIISVRVIRRQARKYNFLNSILYPNFVSNCCLTEYYLIIQLF